MYFYLFIFSFAAPSEETYPKNITTIDAKEVIAGVLF